MDYEFKHLPCNLCGRDDAVELGRRTSRARVGPDTRIVRCRGCGLIYPNPMPIPDAAQLQAAYQDADAYFPTPIDDRRMAFYASLLRDLERTLGGARRRLLDFGSGRGEMLVAAKGRGWDPVGFDVSTAFARQASARAGVPVLTGRLEDHALAAGSFDAISAISVLHNCLDPRGQLEALRRLLRPGGALVVEVTNNDALYFHVADLFHRVVRSGLTSQLSPTFGGYQVYGFTESSLARILAETGFVPTSMVVSGGLSGTGPVRGVRDRLRALSIAAVETAANRLGRGAALTALAVKAGD